MERLQRLASETLLADPDVANVGARSSARKA
jgi:hypothetical protein